MEQKKHDWLATIFFSPDKSIQDLADFGITTDNSTLYSRDYYKNIPEIKEAFQTDSGKFDEYKFNSFYNDALYLYNVAEENKIEGSILNTFEYDPLDYFAPLNSKTRDVSASLNWSPNPERRSTGLVNIRETSDPTMSVREVAQTSQVFNYDTGQFENWTPNSEGGLISGLFMPTLVLAQWDEDGTHELNGRIFNHKKGDLKFNQYGDPYYETLGNRSVYGKDLLHYTDVLTVDGSKWNKYDFFDSDGLDKSVVGTVAKTVFNIVPYFIPWLKIGKIYTALSVTTELGQVFPTLYKSIAGIAFGDTNDMDSINVADDVLNYFSRFDQSQSDYARSAGFFSLENIGDIAASASSQLFQQRWISTIPGMFSKSENLSETAIKWGRGLSFAYMASTSGQFAYEQFKEAGASDRAAGLGTLATSLAFFGLMKNNYFNYEDVLFGGSQLSKSTVKKISKDSTDGVAKTLGYSVETAIFDKKEAAKWVMEMTQKITKKIKNMNPQSILSTSYKEGIEETMEEVSTDVIKGVFSGLNSLGLIDANKTYDFGITVDDIFTRYTTSFIGGGIGGAVFGIHNKFDKQSKLLNENLNNKTLTQQLVYLARNGKINEVRNEINRLYRLGKLASTNLSGINYVEIKDGDKIVKKFEPANPGESQNDVVYNLITAQLNTIESIIKEEGLEISDENLQLLIAQHPNLDESQKEGLKNLYIANIKGKYDSSIFTSGLTSVIFQEFNSLSEDILKTKLEMESMLTLGPMEPKTTSDVESHIKAVEKNAKYIELKNKLEKLRSERNAILSGQRNDYYMGLVHFAGRTNLARLMNNKYGLHQYTMWKYGKYYDALSPGEQQRISIEYGQYSAVEKEDIIKAYDLFVSIQNSSNPLLKDISSRMINEEQLHSGYDEFFVIQQDINAEITENETKIEQLKQELPDGETTSEEIEKLESKNVELKTILESRQFEGRAGVINLSEKGKELLQRNTPEYANSYLNYLSYILQNGLYLDKDDADLHYILQNYFANFDPSKFYNAWKQYIINKEGSYDTSLDDWYNPIANAMADILTAVRNGDIKTASESLQALMSGDLIGTLEATVNDFNSQEFWDAMIPMIGTYRLSTYLNELSRYKSLIQSSPVYDLIAKIAQELGVSNNLVELLHRYQKEFFQAETVHDFIIQDAKAIDDLKKLRQIINIANALVLAGSKNGYNHSINPYRAALNKEILSEFTDVQIHNMTNDLNLIDTQVETLISIAEKNNAQKLREQKDIEINMKSKFFEVLVGVPSEEDPSKRVSHLKTILKNKLHIDIDDIIQQLGQPIPENITENNIKEVNAFMTALETAIYENSRSLNVQDIIEALFSAFDTKDSIINGQSTKIGKNNQTIINDYDQIIYLATIFGAPSINFNNRLKTVLGMEGYDKAPIFSQEYAARIIYSFANSTELFNGIVGKIKELTSSSSDTYIKNKTALDNIMFVLGSAGVGKTTGVAKLAVAILGEQSVTIVAPTEEQVDNLEQNITNASISVTKQEIREQLLGIKNWSKDQIVTDSEIVDGKSVVKSVRLNPNVRLNNPTNLSANKIMIIDEITLFNRLDLELLSRWAVENGVKIIALGDPIQNAVKLTIQDVYSNYSGLEDTWHIKAPRLTAPMRPSNVGKYDNTINLSVALESVNDKYSENPTWGINELDDAAKEQLSKAPIVLKYFEDNTTFFGDKIVSGDITSYIEKFKKLSESGQKVAIITDNTDKYTAFGLPVIHPNEVQGREFDYVIVDINLSLLGEYDKLRSFYTFTQRSRKGTIIVNNGGIPPSISSMMDITASYNISIEPDSIVEFKKWKLENIYTGNDVEIQDINNDDNRYQDPEDEVTNTDENTTQEIQTPEENISTSDSIIKDDKKPIENTTKSIIGNVTPTPTIKTPIKPEIPKPKISQDINVQTPGKIVCSAKEYFTRFENEIYPIYSSKLNDFFGLEMDMATTMHLLRAWFLYGHNKNGETFKYDGWGPGISRILHNKIHGLLENNPNPRFVIENHILVVELLNNDDIIKIPLLYVNNIESGEVFGDIEINAVRDVNKFGNKTGRKTAIRIPNYMQKSVPYVWRDSKSTTITYREFHSGQTFIFVNADPFDTDWEKKYLTVSEDNPTTYIPSVQSFKVKRVCTWAQLKEHMDRIPSKIPVEQSVITGTTVGGIIALAYNLDEAVRNNLIKYLSKKGKGIRIVIHNGALPNPYVDITTIEQFDEELSKLANNNFSIQLTYTTNRGIEVNRIGEYDLRTVLTGFNAWGLLEEVINQSNLFKNGIYIQDYVPNNIKGWIPMNHKIDHYLIDFDAFYGNDFLINVEQTEESEDDKLIAKLNEQLQSYGINDRTITSLDVVQSVLDDINTSTLSNLSSPKFIWLRFDGNKIIKENVSALLPFIASKLNMLVDGDWEDQGMNINFFRSFINENTCKFEGFYVNLPDGNIKYYVLFRDNNTLNIKEVHQDVYSSWSNLVRASQISFEKYPTVGEYINKIINNEDVDSKTAETFTRFAGEFTELSTLINNYLLTKLENDEC